MHTIKFPRKLYGKIWANFPENETFYFFVNVYLVQTDYGRHNLNRTVCVYVLRKQRFYKRIIQK